MITGLGFTEILTILLLVLMFFGSKELPRFVRETARLFGKLRQYSDKVRRELDDISRAADPKNLVQDTPADRKQELRAQYLAARKALPEDRRRELSRAICEHVLSLEDLQSAKAVMVYLHTTTEVQTDVLIEKLYERGTRVILPYCRPAARDLGIAEVTDVKRQTAPGEHGILEPVGDCRNNFLKSDVQAVICPGVGFDRLGGRLGRGKGYYDNFLRELSGRVPFVGLAFSCQISQDPFPFDYHDVPVDQVVTEDGPLIDQPQRTGLSS